MKLDERAYASIYEREEGHWWFLGRRKVLATLLAGLRPPGDWNVLDVGCGTGGNFSFLDAYGRVQGCDYSEEAIRYCLMRGTHPVRVASIYDLPYEEGSFDLVTCLDVIEHLRLDLPAFRELNRMLKPGGHLLVTLPIGEHLYSDFDCLAGHLRRYTMQQARLLLSESGFDPVRLTCYTTLVHPLIRYYRRRGDITRGRSRYTIGMETPIPHTNHILKLAQDIEAWLISRWDLPWGSSVAALARKS